MSSEPFRYNLCGRVSSSNFIRENFLEKYMTEFGPILKLFFFYQFFYVCHVTELANNVLIRIVINKILCLNI